MPASAKYSSKNGFTLDEEKLRKINDILVQRGKSLSPNCRPTYKVKRSDVFSYETQELQVIIDEDNSNSRKIEQISIKMSCDNDLTLDLTFDSDTKLNVDGNNRDAVFLLYSELKAYLQSEVNANKIFILQKFLTSEYITILFALLLIGWIIAIDLISEARSAAQSEQYNVELAEYERQVIEWERVRNEVNDSERQEKIEAGNLVLEQDDLAMKLNFLIENSISTSPEHPEYPTYPNYSNAPITIFFRPVFMFIIMLGIIILTMISKFLVGRLSNRSIYLIGKEIQRFEVMNRNRERIVWGVIITFLISVAAGIAVWIIIPSG